MASAQIAGIGDNSGEIDFAKLETDRLEMDYRGTQETVEAIVAEAKVISLPIADDDDKGDVVDLIKRIRDLSRRVDATREVEKQPHLRRSQAVDQFFFRMVDKLTKRDRKNMDGVGDTLQKELTTYDTRKLAEEQERRRLAALEAARIAEAARKKAEEEARIAEEARLAAERARKPETTAAKAEIAQQAEQVASAATVEAIVADRAAEDAHVDTLTRPADIMRTRTAAGSLSTMATETYAEIEDVNKLDKESLWGFIAFAEKEKALRAWAKSTGHTQQMEGAKIGRRPKSQVR
jgi:membrane protein involved in colicin uptake